MATMSSSSSSRPHVLLLFFFLLHLAAVGADEHFDNLLLGAAQRLPPPPPDSFLLVLMSHMPQDVSLSCKTWTPGSSDEYFQSFSLQTNEARRKYFRLSDKALSHGYAVSCYYAYRGNFAADVVIFNSLRPDADQCRVKNDGCRILIDADSVMYNITRSGGKQVVGDLPAKQCKWFLFFAYDYRQKPHRHPFVGHIISRWQWWISS